ncbi:uncharacterized protein LOC114338125 [Diabrotica virgifera virgifera]|uniref:Uncharacterized protein LOC114338125 n=1 Tax=Diabrotica virgifera virgifera TaxID=50390 RepID=A0A6P7G637_DIAVI|nr:uncharacterized protein LOC114338125 [Diabrotica virgifera virgifera]
MKSLICFLSFVAIALGALQDDVQQMNQILQICQRKWQIPQDILTYGVAKAKPQDRNRIGSFALCVYTNLGFMNRQGDLLDVQVREYYRESDRAGEININDILTKCRPPRGTPEQKAFFHEECMENLQAGSQDQLVEQYYGACQQQLGLSDEFIKNSQDKTRLGSFFLCIYSNLGVLSSKGDLIENETTPKCSMPPNLSPALKAWYYQECFKNAMQ